MVAALGPLDLRSTHGAEDYRVDAGADSLERALHGCLAAREVTVPVFPTPEADRV